MVYALFLMGKNAQIFFLKQKYSLKSYSPDGDLCIYSIKKKKERNEVQQ